MIYICNFVEFVSWFFCFFSGHSEGNGSLGCLPHHGGRRSLEAPFPDSRLQSRTPQLEFNPGPELLKMSRMLLCSCFMLLLMFVKYCSHIICICLCDYPCVCKCSWTPKYKPTYYTHQTGKYANERPAAITPNHCAKTCQHHLKHS